MDLKKRGALYKLIKCRSELKDYMAGRSINIDIKEPLLSTLIEILDNNEEAIIDRTISYIEEQ
jgi:hypothetical protein